MHRQNIVISNACRKRKIKNCTGIICFDNFCIRQSSNQQIMFFIAIQLTPKKSCALAKSLKIVNNIFLKINIFRKKSYNNNLNDFLKAHHVLALRYYFLKKEVSFKKSLPKNYIAFAIHSSICGKPLILFKNMSPHSYSIFSPGIRLQKKLKSMEFEMINIFLNQG